MVQFHKDPCFQNGHYLQNKYRLRKFCWNFCHACCRTWVHYICITVHPFLAPPPEELYMPDIPSLTATDICSSYLSLSHLLFCPWLILGNPPYDRGWPLGDQDDPWVIPGWPLMTSGWSWVTLRSSEVKRPFQFHIILFYNDSVSPKKEALWECLYKYTGRLLYSTTTES